ASSDKSPHVTIHIKLPDGTTYPHPGLCNLLDIQVQSDTDTVVVRAQLPNTEGMLIPGGIVGVMVERGAPHQSLVVRNPPCCSIKPVTMSCWSTMQRRLSSGA